MDDDTSRVIDFGIFLIFNGSTRDYGKLSEILIQNGFVQKIPRVGYYLVAEENGIPIDISS